MKRGTTQWSAYLVAFTIGAAAYLWLPPVAHNGVLFNVLGLSTAVALVAGARRQSETRRLPWYLFAAGQVLFVIGDDFYYTYPKLTGENVPFPSIGDGFYLAFYPAAMAGLLLLIRHRNPQRDTSSLIDALIITIGVALISWIFLMAPYANDASLSATDKAFSMAYPVMDVLLLAAVVRLAVDSGRRPPAFYLLLAGVVCLLVADAIYGYVTLNGTYETGTVLDAVWLAFYALWGAAALHPSTRSLSEPAPQEATRLSASRLVLLTSATLMAPAMQVVQSLRHQRIEVPVIVGASVALFVLVVARMVGVIRLHEQAESRERALRRAGAALVTAATRESTYAAALRAISELAGPDVSVRVRLRKGDAFVRVAGDDGVVGRSLPVGELPVAVLAALDEGHGVTLTPADRLFDAFAVAPSAKWLVLSPLRAHQALLGFLIVGSEVALSRATVAGIDALGSQIALALEAVALAEDLHRQQTEARFRSLVQNSSDVVTVIQPDGTIVYQSPSVERLFGHQPGRTPSTSILDWLHPDDGPRLLALLSRSGTAGTRQFEGRWRRRDGSWADTETLCTDLLDDPSVEGVVLNTRDISERKAFEEQLSHQAFHDSVTGLANRALFRDRVDHALDHQGRARRPVAVLFIDLDDFKTINDSLGHSAGDDLVTAIAVRIRNCLRSSDTAARLGGDEFGVLLEEATEAGAVETAERVIGAMADPFPLLGKEVFVGVSIGIVVSTSEERAKGGADAFLRNADAAMYIAKAQGKGGYQLFEPAMHDSVVRRLELQADLRRALENDEFRLHYQPIMDIATGAVAGVEALIRWDHPRRGPLPPCEFIPLAEETGLIVPIGRWVVREACRRGRQLQSLHPSHRRMYVSVNLSARQLQDTRLVDDVASAIAESGLAADDLVLEITETAMMEDVELAVMRLSELKGLDIRLAVDDFGVGYSSLNSLRNFPVDVLKIDRSFTSRLRESVEDEAMVTAILGLGDILGLRTVAEGIEEVEQLDRLRDLGCVAAQGYLLSRPLDDPAIEEFLLRDAQAGRVPAAAAAGRSGPA